ncbi:MAG: hypothetical protein IKU34_00385 [Clostridia bacterium]|nr:hypothetical protein [Clostridia bacterium]
MKRLFDGQSVLDEREMMEMYRIEHAGLWAMYILLAAAVVVQMMLGAPIVQLAGELAVLLLVSVGMIIAYARKGIWDEHSRPGRRGNAAYSAACAFGVALIVAALRGSLLWGLISGAAMFLLCFALLSMMGAYLARRQSREAQALEDDEIDS